MDYIDFFNFIYTIASHRLALVRLHVDSGYLRTEASVLLTSLRISSLSDSRNVDLKPEDLSDIRNSRSDKFYQLTDINHVLFDLIQLQEILIDMKDHHIFQLFQNLDANRLCCAPNKLLLDIENVMTICLN